MFTHLSSIAGSLLAQTADTSSSVSTIGLGVLCATFAVVAYALMGRSKKLALEIEVLSEQVASANDSLKSLTSREKKLEKDLSEKTKNLSELKKDMGAQRKKTHTAQEEIKSLRAGHKVEMEQIRKNIGGKPAFTAAPVKEVKAEPAPIKPETVPEAPEVAPAVLAQEAKVTELETLVTRLKSKLEDNKKYLGKAKAEVKDSRYRVERYRRVDIMTKNKTGVLEDKLLTLGRQYYDVISENAALKGDVQPPRPRTLVEAEARAVERAAQDAALEEERVAAKEEQVAEAPVQLDASHFEPADDSPARESETAASVAFEESETPDAASAPA